MSKDESKTDKPEAPEFKEELGGPTKKEADAKSISEEPKEPENVEEKKDKTGFELETLDDLRKILVMAKGGDPNAQHTLNEFLKFNSNIERTNLPTRLDVQRVIFADYAGKTLYPDLEDDPFSKLANSISIAFMAKGGDKSKQFVELMKQTPSLSELKILEDSSQRGLVDRMLGRGKKE